jgi:hypothetical protein
MVPEGFRRSRHPAIFLQTLQKNILLFDWNADITPAEALLE